jgi:hypothetical protein
LELSETESPNINPKAICINVCAYNEADWIWEEVKVDLQALLRLMRRKLSTGRESFVIIWIIIGINITIQFIIVSAKYPNLSILF